MAYKHPKALPFLFFTEMWERFGYYVVQGLLVLYLTKSFGYTDDKSYTVLGVFSALAYISPMAGGYIADKVLGYRTAIIWGGIFLILGYALLSLTFAKDLFYLSLATIIVGNGLFKPNISSLLGTLYKPGDSARDSGFTFFYIGINLGVLLSGFSGTIVQHFGWSLSFALASVGLIIALFVFSAGLKWGEITIVENNETQKWYFNKSFILLYCFASIGILNLVLQSSVVGKWLLPLVGVFLIFFLFILAFKQTTQSRNQLVTLNILILSSVVFWMLYLQIFSSANLFIDRLVNKTIFGIEIPTTAFYSFVSVYIMILGPIFARSWQSLNQNSRNPSPMLKFVLGIALCGVGFLILTLSTYFVSNNMVNMLWIILSYLIITTGELFLSPIGLSAVTILSPPKLTGMMMGVWFVALGFGGQFGGMLAKISSVPSGVTDPLAQLAIYRSAFLDYAIIAFVVAILLFFVQKYVRKKFTLL